MDLRAEMVDLTPSPGLHPIGWDESFVYYKFSTILAVQGCVIRDIRFKIYRGKEPERASLVAQVMIYKYEDGARVNELIAVDIYPRHDITDNETLYYCTYGKYTDLIVRYEAKDNTPVGNPTWIAAIDLRCSNGIVCTHVYQL